LHFFPFTDALLFAYGGNMQNVREIMNPKVVAIGAADRLLTAEDIMTLGHVRHMPVVQSGRLVGVVSERDLLRASPSCLGSQATEDRRAFLNSVAVGDVMSSPPVLIDIKASVQDAAKLMVANEIGCLPVVGDAGELLGILTETHMLEVLAAHL
jgi:CBS domain-containing protein